MKRQTSSPKSKHASNEKAIPAGLVIHERSVSVWHYFALAIETTNENPVGSEANCKAMRTVKRDETVPES
jgi:hypothetical protein